MELVAGVAGGLALGASALLATAWLAFGSERVAEVLGTMSPSASAWDGGRLAEFVALAIGGAIGFRLSGGLVRRLGEQGGSTASTTRELGMRDSASVSGSPVYWVPGHLMHPAYQPLLVTTEGLSDLQL